MAPISPSASAIAVAPVESAGDLLSAVGRGDRRAFRSLYDLTRAKIYGVCIAMLRQRESADEAFQEAFVRIWEKADLYDAAKGDALAWMTAVARRCVLDRMRRQTIVGIALDEIDPGAAELAIAPLAMGRTRAITAVDPLPDIIEIEPHPAA